MSPTVVRHTNIFRVTKSEEILVDNIVNAVQKEFPGGIKGENIRTIKQVMKLNLRNR